MAGEEAAVEYPPDVDGSYMLVFSTPEELDAKLEELRKLEEAALEATPS